MCVARSIHGLPRSAANSPAILESEQPPWIFFCFYLPSQQHSCGHVQSNLKYPQPGRVYGFQNLIGIIAAPRAQTLCAIINAFPWSWDQQNFSCAVWGPGLKRHSPRTQARTMNLSSLGTSKATPTFCDFGRFVGRARCMIANVSFVRTWRHWWVHPEVPLKVSNQIKDSAAGNWTRVFRVTGGNTHHYTTADAGDEQIDKSCNLQRSSLNALSRMRFSITSNHWMTSCSTAIYIDSHYLYQASTFFSAGFTPLFIPSATQGIMRGTKSDKLATRKTFVVSEICSQSQNVSSAPYNKRPAWPQQPNLYLEPKWLRCWLMTQHCGNIDSKIHGGDSLSPSEFVWKWKLEIGIQYMIVLVQQWCGAKAKQ